ncbi:MAG TPA: ABC transporter ATP-binding protein [Thermomicrobiales bacterium]|jgi:ABC-2 type transport system ATP-binding protein|nr:ABC transporter ATP-binding protein [Thermomicrobiales bacterium]
MVTAPPQRPLESPVTSPHPEAHAPAANAAPIIETDALRKEHGRKVVSLQELTMAVPPGPIGLLGANGAGKTTLIRLLLGLTAPTAGSARVLGLDSRKDAIRVRQQVGYMPESDVLPTGATAADFVAHMGEMSGLPTRAARQRAADVLYQVGLDEERYRLIKGFSTGMKQRVKLAQAIVHDPKLVFLDEPTNGMDPQGRDEMLALIQRISRRMGISIVMSSHILEDIERTCDHVVILDRGRLVANQSIRGLADQSGGNLLLRIDGDPETFGTALGNHGLTVSRPERAGVWEELIVRYDDDRVFDVIRDTAVETGTVIRSLRNRSRSLEDIYFSRVAEADEAEAQGKVGGQDG